MTFFSAVLQALIEPARQLGVPSLPQRILDAVVPDRVAGRRAWAAGGRAAIEARGVNRPNSLAYARELQDTLEEHPAVVWARVNAPLGRVVVCFDLPEAPGESEAVVAQGLLAELVPVVDEVEARYPEISAPDRAGPSMPVDRVPAERAGVELLADVAGLAAALAARLVKAPALPQEVAAGVSLVDSTPRLRSAVVRALGYAAGDAVLALSNAAVQALSQGFVGLGVDAAQRALILSEYRAEAAAWRVHGRELMGAPDDAAAAPIAVERTARLKPGPVEDWADRAAALGAAAFGVAAPATGEPRQALGFALAALPKAGRIGREGFCTWFGRSLARRGALVLDPGTLRRLDRIGTVVLDSAVLTTGRQIVGRVVPLPGADPAVVAERLHALFEGTSVLSVQHDGEWALGPIDALRLVGRRGARERARLESADGLVLGLAQGTRLMAVLGALLEPHESLDALAAACHRSGRRLVIAGDLPPHLSLAADELVPGGPRLTASVRGLQADGTGVLLVSGRPMALAAADVGVGVTRPNDAAPPWGAHILVGSDYLLAALLIEACRTAEDVSRRSTMFAEAGTALGGISATAAGDGGLAANRSLFAVNVSAALSLGLGVWAAVQLLRRPLSPPISRIAWHAMPVEAVLDALAASETGLASEDVRRRQLRSQRTPAIGASFSGSVAAELNNPLTPILGAGAALSAAIGAVIDAGLVAAVMLASAVIGGVQRWRTDRALAELLARTAVTGRVLRDGKEAVLAAELLVPGDVLIAGPGDVMPADCRLLEAAQLQVDESSLTGEPFPVRKSPLPVIADTVAERTSMLYEGTTIAAGRGTAVVVATGSSTEAGRSTAVTRVASAPGGVEGRLARITNVTLPITLGSAAAVVGAGLLRGRSLRTTAGAGVSLAVAAVPEGLPFLVTAAQLASARRLSSRNTLVRNPRTIEALGRVNVLCFDKTGTLTEGRIALTSAAGPDGRLVPLERLTAPLRRVVAVGLQATPQAQAKRQLEHMTDRAVAVGAREAGISRSAGEQGWRRVRSLPFEPSQAYHATLAETRAGALLSVKGAPETVLERCASVRDLTGSRPLGAVERRRLGHRVERLAGQGYRLLAVAERRYPEVPAGLEDSDIADLCLLGFLALTDPVRASAAESLAALRRAGVQIIMITGDHPGTASAIAEHLNLLNGGRVITGSELDMLSDDALARVLPDVAVVARSTPTHKVRVVQAFQRLGRSVAMTGDGANDAPAIRLADVGIALGRRGTPAARAAGDLVVTDDRLETIIAALIEGRGMWGSVRRALGILVGGNLGEIAFTVLGALLRGISPLGARQLLLVNLLTDLAPALAVALRPPHAASTAVLLAEGPESSLGSALNRDVALRAAVTAAGAGAAWLIALALGFGAAAPTVALAGLVGSQLAQTLAAGGPSRGVVLSGLISVGALAAVVQTPALSAFFGSVPLGLLGWGIAGAASVGAALLAALWGSRAFWVARPDEPSRQEAVPQRSFWAFDSLANRSAT